LLQHFFESCGNRTADQHLNPQLAQVLQNPLRGLLKKHHFTPARFIAIFEVHQDQPGGDIEDRRNTTLAVRQRNEHKASIAIIVPNPAKKSWKQKTAKIRGFSCKQV
jgi:hypothetical protein